MWSAHRDNLLFIPHKLIENPTWNLLQIPFWCLLLGLWHTSFLQHQVIWSMQEDILSTLLQNHKKVQWHINFTNYIPYGRKFSTVQNFVVMPPELSEEIVAAFIFMEQTCNTQTTPLQHANLATRRNKEVSLCNNGWVFLLCGGHHVYKNMWTATMGKKLACQTEGVSTTDLKLNSFGASLTINLLASCLVAGWFCSTATI